MNRTQKEEAVAEMHQVFQSVTSVIVAHQTGLTVAESTDLRRRVRTAGARFKVTKNRLAKIALKDTQFESIAGLFTGPTAIAVSEDPVAAAKVMVEFAKGNDKLVILGGSIGTQALDAAGVEALSKIPSLDELRATLVGLISTPATRIAGVLQAPGGQLARVFKAYADKQSEAA